MLITNKSWENIAQLRNLGEKKKMKRKIIQSYSYEHMMSEYKFIVVFNTKKRRHY